MCIRDRHFYRSNIPLEEIKSVPVSWLQCVHICDAPLEIPTDPKTLAQTAREERLLPGEGVIKIADIVSKMPVDATRGIEIPNIKRLGEYGVKEYARLALEKTKNYLRNAV